MDPHLKRAATVHHDRGRTADALVRYEMPIEQLIRYLIRATAPLELLLGQSAHLIRVTDEDTTFWIWLSHYAPKRPDGDGGRAA